MEGGVGGGVGGFGTPNWSEKSEFEVDVGGGMIVE